MLALLAQLWSCSLCGLHCPELVAKGLQQNMRSNSGSMQKTADATGYLPGTRTTTQMQLFLGLKSQESSCCHVRAVGLTLMSPLPCYQAEPKLEHHSSLSRR